MNETQKRIDWDAVRAKLAHNQAVLEQEVQCDPAKLLTEFHHRAERLRLRQNRETLRANLLSVLVFRLGNERYAVELCSVAQVHACPPITSVPGSSTALLGLASFQGDVLSMLDPSRALGVACDNSQRGYALLIHGPRGRIGLWVERADEVLDLDLDRLAALENTSETPAGQFVRGVTPDHVLLLDLDRLLAALTSRSPNTHTAVAT